MKTHKPSHADYLRTDTYYAALDGLRGVAATLVFLSHAGIIGLTPSFSFHEVGQLGVMVFFALSGFLMSRKHLDTAPSADAIWKFFSLRAARVLPLYYAVGIASFVMSSIPAIQWPYTMTPYLFVRHLLLANDTYVFWTIPAEVQFYIAFPFFWVAVSRDRYGGMMAALGTVCVCLLLQYYEFPGKRMWLTACFHMFAFGAISGLTSLSQPGFRVSVIMSKCVTPISILLVIVCVFFDRIFISVGVNTPDIWNIGWLAVPVAAVVWAVAYCPRSLLAKGLSLGAVRWLGGVSYSLYLWHTPVLYACRNAVDSTNISPAFALSIAAAVSLGAASISCLLIEVPARRALLKLLQ